MEWRAGQGLTLTFVHGLWHGAMHKGCSHLCQLVHLQASHQDYLVNEIKILIALVLKRKRNVLPLTPV